MLQKDHEHFTRDTVYKLAIEEPVEAEQESVWQYRRPDHIKHGYFLSGLH